MKQKYTICLDSYLSEELKEKFPKRRTYGDWCIISHEVKEDIIYKSDYELDFPDRLQELFALIAENTEGYMIVDHGEATYIIDYYKKLEGLDNID